MAFCTNCGTKLDGNACTKCGEAAYVPEEPPISAYYQPYPPVYQQPYQQPNYQSQQYPVNQQHSSQSYYQPQYYPQGAYQPYWPPVPEKPKTNVFAIILVMIVVGIVLIASLNSAINFLDLEGSDQVYYDYDYEILPNKYALVVGISNYASFDDLSYCDNDARAWEHYLRVKGYEVRTLVDSQATKDAIIEGIQWMDSVETNESDCAFTFSGHGVYEFGSYICPYDSSLYSYDRDISNSELGDAFYNFDSEHIFFFFDSCYSGGMDAVIGNGRYVTQSSGAQEISYEHISEQNGLWTYYFLEWGLTDNGYEDMSICFDNSYDQAVQTSIRLYEEAHPEEEYYGSAPFNL